MPRVRKKLSRKKSYKNKEPLYVIATEGACTESIYFNGVFRKKNIRLKLLPTKNGNSSPGRVLERLKSYKSECNADPNELWLVIDKDNWKDNTLQKVAEDCDKNNFNFILSNPCFELWLILHQSNPKTPMTVQDCSKEIKKLIPSFSKSKYDCSEIAKNVSYAIDKAKLLDNGNNI